MTEDLQPTAPRILSKINFEIFVREDGWIEVSPEIAAFIMQVADSLLNQKAYEMQLADEAKPRIVLAS